MQALIPATSIPVAIWLCQALQRLQDPNPFASVTAHCDRGELAFDVSIFVPATALCPRWFYGANANDSLLLIGGTENLGQAGAQVLGLIGSPVASIVDPEDAATAAAGEQILAALRLRDVRIPVRLTIAGHSFGGQIAQYMVTLPQTEGTNVTGATITTFGSPRVGGRTISALVRGRAFCQRWMNTEDPVPLIPPHTTETNLGTLLFGYQAAIRFHYFMHPTGGTELNAEGAFQDATLPSAAVVNFNTSMASWIQDYVNDRTGPHALATYERRLLLAERRPNGGRLVQQGEAERVNNPEPRKVDGETTRVTNAIVNLGETQGREHPFIPKLLAFQAVRLGKLWHVALIGSIVMFCGTKRRAKSQAALGNAFLLRLQGQAVVNPQSILDQLEIYFRLASDVQSGFRPVMNVSMPQ